MSTVLIHIIMVLYGNRYQWQQGIDAAATAAAAAAADDDDDDDDDKVISNTEMWSFFCSFQQRITKYCYAIRFHNSFQVCMCLKNVK